MSKAGDIAQVSAKGSFHLLWGLVISSVIGSIGTIFIGRLLESNLYGLYTIALNVPALIAIFREWGIHSAIVKFTAQYRSEGRTQEIRSVVLSGLMFEVVSGIVLSLISFLLSGVLANYYHRPEITLLLQIASLSILTGSLVTAATAVFTGTEKMHLNSIMVVIQSTIRTALTIVLVIIGLSTSEKVSGAVIGFTSGSLIAALIGLLFIWMIYRKLPKPVSLKLEFRSYLREMLKYGVPISFSLIAIGFLGQFYSFLLPIHYVTDNTMIGNYGISQSFVVLIGFFATPITTMMFPAFSKLDPQKDKEVLKSVYQFSVKYASLLVVPVVALVMCLSQPAISTLFGHTYDSAPLFLTLLSVGYFFTALGSLSTGNLIMSQGESKTYLKLNLLTAAIGFPMGLILILQFGVIGLIATTLINGLPSLLISLYWVKKHYDVTVDWNSSARIVFSSAFTGALTYIVVSQFALSNLIKLIFGVFIFFLILIPSLLLTKSITRQDIANLKLITRKLAPINKVTNVILAFLEKIMNFFKL